MKLVVEIHYVGSKMPEISVICQTTYLRKPVHYMGNILSIKLSDIIDIQPHYPWTNLKVKKGFRLFPVVHVCVL